MTSDDTPNGAVDRTTGVEAQPSWEDRARAAESKLAAIADLARPIGNGDATDRPHFVDRRDSGMVHKVLARPEVPTDTKEPHGHP